MARPINPGERRLLQVQRRRFVSRSGGAQKIRGSYETPQEYNRRVFEQREEERARVSQEVTSSLNRSAERTGSTTRFTTGKNEEGGRFLKSYTSTSALQKQGYYPYSEAPKPETSGGGRVLFARSPYAGASFSEPKNFSEDPREAYIQERIKADLEQKRSSKFFGVVPNPFARADAYVISREQAYKASGGRGATFAYSSKRFVYGLQYDKLSSFEREGKTPGKGFGLSSGILESVTDPSTIPTSFGAGYLFGRGASSLSNYRAIQAGRAGRNAYSTYRGTQGAIATVGIGATAVSVATTYKREGYYGLGKATPGFIAGFGGGVAGFRSGKPGVILGGYRVVKPALYESRFGSDVVSASGKRVVAADLSVYGKPQTVLFEQQVLVSGARSATNKPYATTITGFGGFRAGGKSFVTSQQFEGFLTPRRGAFVFEERGQQFAYLSRSGRPKIFSDVYGESVYSSANEYAITPARGGKNIISGGRGVTLYENYPVTQRYYGLTRPTEVQQGYDPFEFRPTLFAAKGNPKLVGFDNKVVYSRGVVVQRMTPRAVVSSKLTDPGLEMLRGGGLIKQPKTIAIQSRAGVLGRDYGAPQKSQLISRGSFSQLDLPGLPVGGVPRTTFFMGGVYGTGFKSSFDLMVSPVSRTTRKNDYGQRNVNIPSVSIERAPMRKTFSGLIQVPIVSTSQAQRTTTAQISVQSTKAAQDLRFGDVILPFSTNKPFPPGGGALPIMPFGIPPTRGKEFSGSTRNFKYTPSLVGVLGGYTATSAPKVLGGFEIRPVIVKRKKKR